MESKIEALLEKYWNGETSLEDEHYLKAYFRSNPNHTEESYFFNFLKNEQEVVLEGSRRKNSYKTWLSAAAIVTGGILTALLVLQEAKKDPFAMDDPKEALEATKKALMMIGTELNEGQSYAMELIKINKAKEELTEESEAL